MNALADLSVSQLKRAITLREKIEALTKEFNKLIGGDTASAKSGKRTMSAAGRARVSAAQKARWAKIKGTKSAAPKVKGKRKMSAAGRAAISKAAKARWAKMKAAGKSKL